MAIRIGSVLVAELQGESGTDIAAVSAGAVGPLVVAAVGADHAMGGAEPKVTSPLVTTRFACAVHR
jgi:hypothetical protein